MTAVSNIFKQTEIQIDNVSVDISFCRKENVKMRVPILQKVPGGGYSHFFLHKLTVNDSALSDTPNVRYLVALYMYIVDSCYRWFHDKATIILTKLLITFKCWHLVPFLTTYVARSSSEKYETIANHMITVLATLRQHASPTNSDRHLTIIANHIAVLATFRQRAHTPSSTIRFQSQCPINSFLQSFMSPLHYTM